MEKIRIFRISSILTWLTIGLAILMMVFGIIELSEHLSKVLKLRGSNERLSGILFIIQGVIFITWGIVYLNRRKYFIWWDERELHLHLPATKKPERISIEDIRAVNIRLFEIELKIGHNDRVIDLNSLRDEELKRVKEKFEYIKKDIQVSENEGSRVQNTLLS